MGGGVVLDFSDNTFGEMFDTHGVDIHGATYHTYGTSKAKKLRAFWEHEPDSLVGPVLSEMLDVYEARCLLDQRSPDTTLLAKCREIVSRIGGSTPGSSAAEDALFLGEDLAIPDVTQLPVDSHVAGIIRDRLGEAQACLRLVHTCRSSSNVAAFWKRYSRVRLNTIR